MSSSYPTTWCRTPPSTWDTASRKRSPVTWRTASCSSSRWAARCPAMASFRTPDPNDPPMTATMNRSGSIPSARRAALRRESDDRSTSRIACRTGAPVISARQRRVLEGHGAGRCRTCRQPARSAGCPVVGNDDHRHSEPPGSEDRRHARVAADGHDDPWLPLAQQPDGCPGAAHHLGDESQVCPGEPPLHADDVEELVPVGRGRQQARFDAALGRRRTRWSPHHGRRPRGRRRLRARAARARTSPHR